MLPDGSSQGYVDKIETFSDYRLFSGLRWPVKWLETGRIYPQIYTTTSVRYNNATDDEFKLPPEVQALLKKQGGCPRSRVSLLRSSNMRSAARSQRSANLTTRTSRRSS